MSVTKRAPYREPRTNFGALLATFRERRVGPVRKNGPWGSSRIEVAAMTQQSLAMRSGVDRAHVSRLESGLTRWPSRDVALRLADALELDEIDQARLIIAAGFWPWPETDDADTELAVRVLLSVVRGDYRRLE